ncbi:MULTISPECIES: amidohydrolase family protein [unclassified Pseudomonas]|uniref:amidohydrolase family protein n=1 Tax=unclassified Pseudomonas TaxID=196821 RepID=UPI00260052E4|nr:MULTISPECIES: amidohydrolase family protein [unclassified Pseudomonas]
MTADRYTGPIIDSHIHLFDASRPEGIPWPEQGHPLHGAALPDTYWQLVQSHPIIGAIVVEASPWRRDNHWLLATLRQSPRLLGFVGNLSPLDAAFHQDLGVLETEPLFLGLRYGNLWQRDLLDDQSRPGFIDAMRRLAASGRTLDSANPDPRLIKGLLRLTDAVPTLRIVVDHLPNAAVPEGQLAEFQRDVFALAERPNVYAKLAEIPQHTAGKLVTDPEFYRHRLAYLWEAFGEHRCFFGSDWPNSDSIADFDSTLQLVRQSVADKPVSVQEKFFLHNVGNAYSLPAFPEPN